MRLPLIELAFLIILHLHNELSLQCLLRFTPFTTNEWLSIPPKYPQLIYKLTWSLSYLLLPVHSLFLSTLTALKYFVGEYALLWLGRDTVH